MVTRTVTDVRKTLTGDEEQQQQQKLLCGTHCKQLHQLLSQASLGGGGGLVGCSDMFSAVPDAAPEFHSLFYLRTH
ncbi:hypothetical protein C0J52_25230 [Blattella germanica]|nr:hypothetical protein C0J52_25230 [Blattella germanica]